MADPSSLKARLQMLVKNQFFWGGLLAVLLVAAVLFVLFNNLVLPTYTRHDASVTVPDVRERPYEEARRVLEDRDLEVEREAQRFNPNLPRDVVSDQSPAPNTSVKPGRRIYLTVNSGTQSKVQVPSVVDISLREARNRLAALGLQVEDVRVDSIPSQYANVVTRQEPEPGDSLSEGSGVIIWYSTGNENAPYVSVPEVTGMSVQQARQALLDSKLRAMVIQGEDSDAAETQTVTRQSREPGTRVRAGFEIRLYTGDGERS